MGASLDATMRPCFRPLMFAFHAMFRFILSIPSPLPRYSLLPPFRFRIFSFLCTHTLGNASHNMTLTLLHVTAEEVDFRFGLATPYFDS